jgi:hypothetical protein
MPRAHTLRSLLLSLLALGHNWQLSSIQAGFVLLPPNCPGSEMDIFDIYIIHIYVRVDRCTYWNECCHLYSLAHYIYRQTWCFTKLNCLVGHIRLKRFTRKLNRMRPKGQRKGTLY